MKTLLSFFILFLSMNIHAQLYGTLEPLHQRIGILYNQEFSNFGVYGKIWWGQISKKTEFAYFHTWNYKISIGGSYQFKDLTSIYLGINRNYFYKVTNNSGMVDLSKLHKISFELGWGAVISKRIAILAITDIFNWETCFGINFKFR
jgi:hypothetical protein